MSTITFIFTKSLLSPISWLTRWALPRSRFALAFSSHVLIEDGEFMYEAIFPQGVRRISRKKALDGCTIVKTLTHTVPDKVAGMEWLRQQDGKRYDLKGAIGASINPNRNWSETDKWFCYELAAGTLKASGLDVFAELSHITEIPLMSLKAERYIDKK